MNAETNTTNQNGAVDRIAFDMSDLIQSLAMANAEIPEFSGRVEEDATKWLSIYERKTATWKEQARIQRIKHHVTGTAQYWFEDQVERNIATLTFPQFKKNFTEKFVDKDKRQVALRNIRLMKFNLEDNRVANFVIDFKHWHSKLNPNASTTMIIHELFERFPVDFQCRFLNAAAIEDITSLDEFTKIAERIERCMRLEEKSSSKLMNASSTTNDDVLKQLLTEMREMRLELNKIKETADRAVNTQSNQKKCFRCNGEWPVCGCKSRCRTCNGTYPTCGCRGMKRAAPNPVITADPGNGNGSRA